MSLLESRLNDVQKAEDNFTESVARVGNEIKAVASKNPVPGNKEISDMLGIDVNTSKSQLSRAKTHLQRELKNIATVKNHEHV
jgi:hypothetical protein